MKPTILVGKPGCGKTTFATRLLTLLGVHHQLYPCGGVADSSLAGTARHWSTGNTALPVSVAVRYRTASPGIVLDEVARAGTSRHNGNMLDALLSMVEPESSCRYLDPYLESEINLSGVCWLGTANDLESVPAPLRDRFRIIAFPSPSVEHLPALANRILKSLIADQGLQVAWATRLDGVELEALADTWPSGGSLRGLRKLVECVLAARDRHTASA
jgi:ATP-dependent Lon protease